MKINETKKCKIIKVTKKLLATTLSVTVLWGCFGSNPFQKELKVLSVSAEENHTKNTGKDTDDENLKGKLFSLFDTDQDESGEEEDGKEETIYVIADANGNPEQTIVSSWLKNGSGKDVIEDSSQLTDIENVKGEETYTQNGESLTWQANGADIHYRGTTTKETPITQQITYYLDGQEISPKELAGKSGKVTIRFDYTNHEQRTVKVDGKEEEVYVPFTVVSGVILDDSFSNVKVNHGKLLTDGEKSIAVGFAMPGLKESLDVDEEDFDEDYEFPDFVEITADVEDFSLNMTVTAAVTGLLSESDLTDELDLTDMDDSMDELTDAMSQLKDGSGELADGMDTLSDKVGIFSDGIGTLKDGLTTYQGGVGTLGKGLDAYATGVKTLGNGISAYTEGVAALGEGIDTLSDSSASLETGVNQLNSSAKTISDGLNQLDKSLNTGMTKKEQAAAKKQVDDSVDAKFQEGSDTYNQITESAKQNFESSLTSAENVASIQQSIQSGLQAQGLTSDGVVAALAQYYAENGFMDTSTGKTYSPQECQAQIPGQNVTYAAYFANAVLNGGLSTALASGVTSGIAQQAASTVADSMVGACKSAAKQAGEEAAISGAESAKQQIAAAIEAKDAASGYSLVSGAKALSDGTQSLADNIPELKKGIGKLQKGAKKLVSKSSALNSGAIQLLDGTGSLKDGVSKLDDGAKELASGALKLNEGAGELTDGVAKLDDGARELADGLVEFDEEAISKLTDAYNGDVKDLVNRLDAISQAGEDYEGYSGAAKGVQTTTKFVFRTAEIY